MRLVLSISGFPWWSEWLREAACVYLEWQQDNEIEIFSNIIKSPQRSLTMMKRHIKQKLMPGLLALVITWTTASFATAASWINASPMTTPRLIHTATLLQNGKVLVVGGHNGVGAIATAELYDPATGIWSLTGPLLTPRYRHTATLLPDGKVLVAGGAGASYSAELFDPVSGTWTATGPLVIARDYHTATLLQNGKVLVAGSPGMFVYGTELYDPVSGTWAAAGSLITPRYYHTATLLPSGKVLVAGGSESIGATRNAEVYDSAGGWTGTAPMSVRSYQHTSTLLANGQVLVAGGTDWIDDGYPHGKLSNATLFNPAAGTWTETGALSTARHGKSTRRR